MTTEYDTSGPNYRPENVRIEHKPEGWHYGPRCPFVLLDFDGTHLRYFETRHEAEVARKSRAGVIKAALTRRANKARRTA